MKKLAKRPDFPPYTINTAVHHLLQAEFDVHRENCTPHYVMKRYNIDAVPYKSDHIDKWRNNFNGVRFEHEQTDFLIYGAVDDVWINPKGELIVVDYKSTGANEYTIYDSYRRQLEIYQWLLIKNGYKVSKIGYFLFAKVNKERGFSEGKLYFDLSIEPLQGESNSWVEDAVINARRVLDGGIPEHQKECKYCRFVLDAK